MNQKPEKSKSQQKRETVQKSASGLVKVRLLSNYRDEAKAGSIYETDAPKAKELVALGRAEYIDNERGGEENMGPNDDNQNEQQPTTEGEAQTPVEGEGESTPSTDGQEGSGDATPTSGDDQASA